MRVLNDEQIGDIVKDSLEEMYEQEAQECRNIVKAQYQQDLKDFVEWLETQIAVYSRTDSNGQVWLLLGEMKHRVVAYLDYVQTLKHLAGECPQCKLSPPLCKCPVINRGSFAKHLEE